MTIKTISDFRHIVGAYSPHDETEASHKNRVISLLSETEIPFSRENLAGHITGSALVVNKDFTKVFLIHHKKLNLWINPGGHAEGSPDFIDVGTRETEEETGLMDLITIPEIFDIDVHPIPENTKNGEIVPAHTHYDMRCLIIANEDEKPILQEEEVLGGRWFTLAEAKETTPHLSFTRMIDKIILNKATYLAKTA